MKRPRESDLTKACLQLLRHKGITCSWRNHTTGIWDPVRKVFRSLAQKGMADILGAIPPHGRLLAVETKSATGRLSLEQRAFLDAVTAAGGLALVVRDVRDLEQALALEGIE